jgi:hypothetical protein
MELYQYLENLFSDGPAAASLFEKLGDEEKSHYDLIQYQRKIVRQNPKLFKIFFLRIHTPMRYNCSKKIQNEKLWGGHQQ